MFLLIGGAMMLWLACTGNQKEKPKPQYPIDDEPLSSILVDVLIAEAILANYPKAKKDSASPAYYAYILKKHKVSRAHLDSCIVYLNSDPLKSEYLYRRVIDSLEKLKNPTAVYPPPVSN
jgi:hypothetical protein